ncbi:RagB/SusD family nutrient uptake outer membrane protein [Flavivirga amylovorans]|uniref:RagB/SusD family nutrient uptake outer membrane protein n=1 Tax=Flavivirga amylovorans TaxID=870486 RepID=A0ABT8X6W4_9FLAO|nr:RagB/SusD family nutrient uptake outer membrane protein [Flavivirga amylovorans]MDO5989743.1 RagB/SusD family nutrient uptake outer membrane protein [Flavivirga amylovorans]
MKNIRDIVKVLFLAVILVSCNEKEFLEETPFDFYSPENSYTTPDQIDLAIVRLYKDSQTVFVGGVVNTFAFFYTTDVGYDAIATTHQLNSWSDKITPETGEVEWMWENLYKIVANANTILSRIGAVEYPSEAARNAKIGEAKFFRALAYRTLGILYGGVPLSLEEITAPKRDFVRDTQANVFAQVINDLEEAVLNLPDADEVEQDGRISKGAANHLLAEMYIINQEYDKAIAAATAVIDNPNYELMTQRFGSRISEPGDVYWDLFRRGNVNRGKEGSSVNREAIWVAQYEHLALGGGDPDNFARFLAPLYWQLKDDNGENIFFSHSSQNGGRGIGWWAASDYMLNQVWANSNNDMRNSEYNIIRDVVVDNPNSAYFGQMMVASGAIDNYPNTINRWWSAIFAKSNPIGNFPDDVIADPETGETNNGAGSTFNDRYMMRLAETYLLRAEAYILKGDQASAAIDINAVRARVNADPVMEADVDMDYLLDERARELFTEEFRLLTLMRMGKIVERVRQHNPMHNGQYESFIINDTQNLWPIPISEIITNTEAVLEQNPGYN